MVVVRGAGVAAEVGANLEEGGLQCEVSEMIWFYPLSNALRIFFDSDRISSLPTVLILCLFVA